MRRPYQHGLVVGKFYPPHAGHLYLIRTAAQHCQLVTVTLLASSVESIPMAARLAWLQDCCRDWLNVRVVAEMDDVRVDYDDPAVWEEHVAIMLAAIARADAERGFSEPVDAVFSSEAYGDELANRFQAAHVCLDQTRSLFPVSGTAVRADLYAHWNDLPSPVRAGLAARVVIVGAESSGTTTLARDIAAALRARGDVWFQTRYVPEFGREYSANLVALARARGQAGVPTDIEWQESDFIAIAHEQNRLEQDAAMQGSPVLICDTDALATTIWHERYRACRSTQVEAIAAAMPARALYVLTDHAGVPFEDDGLRDGEPLRPWMTERFRQVLAAQAIPWIEVRGDRAQRLAATIREVDAVLARCRQFSVPLEYRSPGR
ncbi:AAA family ATPase [Viridibacterium curvum]|uniref:Nicotinamide-nucleotide adenylyltransferase n=1 Tax=Viridibacterium curvum TaxID=1101404 RepID=A0ABP9QGZ5_9RHOO